MEEDEPYSRAKVAVAFRWLGALVLLSALLVNPWIGRWYRHDIVNYSDVMLTYFIWAVAISALIFGHALLFPIVRKRGFDVLTVLVITSALIALSDRLLLARFGLPLWMADVDNHYKHRPHVVRTWGPAYDNKLIRINQYGHHDDDFPIDKKANEFRGVIVGDSIAMGDGVTSDETFSNQLEHLLTDRHRSRVYQIINTGVQGYSTFQEYNVLLRSLAFQPDFIAVGFCLNDLVEPYVTDKRFGGVGSDYHGVAQVPSLLTSYVVNETGYGRLLQKLQARQHSVQRARRWQTYSVAKLAQSSLDDQVFSANWQITLSYLDKMYDTAAARGIKIVLMVFPFTFQFMYENLQAPQRILIEHAKARNVDVIDFTKVFEQLIYDPNVFGLLRNNGFSHEEISALYRRRVSAYYLDQDHYTVAGHKVIATQLYEYLVSHGFETE